MEFQISDAQLEPTIGPVQKKENNPFQFDFFKVDSAEEGTMLSFGIDTEKVNLVEIVFVREIPEKQSLFLKNMQFIL